MIHHIISLLMQCFSAEHDYDVALDILDALQYVL